MARDIWGNRIEDSPEWPEIEKRMVKEMLKEMGITSELELNKKLAEWRFPDAQIHLWRYVIRIKHNTELHPDYPTGVSYFTQSLDACLKHLFPKLVSDNKLWGHFVEFARWEGLPPNRKRLKDGEMIKRLFDPMFICQTIEKIIDL